MIKKIISIIVALSIALSCFSFSVSANPIRNTAGYYTFLYGILNKYKNGEISLNDLLTLAFDEYMNTGMDNIEDGFTSLSDLINSIADTGVDVLSKWLDFNNYGGPVNRDDSILNGYGAVCIDKLVSTGEIVSRYFGAYGVIHTEWDNQLYMYPDDDTNVLYIYDKLGGKETVFTERKKCGSLYSDGIHEWSIYGDWRYSDGTSADDVTPDLPQKDIPNYDDPDVPEDDLIDFLEDLLQDLMLEFPDLSTVEGLLAAILQKCTSIDNKMDEGGGSSDLTSDEFKTMLDQAILALTINNVTETDRLLAELVNIRTILQGFEDGEDIPEDEANSILEGLISGITAGLLSLIGLNVDVGDLVTICKEGGTIGIKLLTGIVDIVAFLSAAVPFNVIKTALTTVFGVIFNENAPADLVFTIDGYDYTFLSVSFFNDTNVAGALSLIKGIISVMIIFIFLKWARKFYMNLM